VHPYNEQILYGHKLLHNIAVVEKMFLILLLHFVTIGHKMTSGFVFANNSYFLPDN